MTMVDAPDIHTAAEVAVSPADERAATAAKVARAAAIRNRDTQIQGTRVHAEIVRERQRAAESVPEASPYEITEADRIMAKLEEAKRARTNLESSFDYRPMTPLTTSESIAVRAAGSPIFAGIPKDEIASAARRLANGLREHGYSRAEIAGMTDKQIRGLLDRELRREKT